MVTIVRTISLFISIHLIIKVSADEKLAEQRIQSYAKCRSDRDCKDNAFCFGNDDTVDGYCKCLNGYELDRNRTFYECFEAVKLGEACERDIHCQILGSPLAICNQYKICDCNSESHNFDGVCYKTAKLGDLCQVDANCYLDDGINESTGYCADGHCQCGPNHKPSEDKTRCLPAKQIGESCTTDDECSLDTANAKCIGSICKCSTEYTESRNGRKCVKAATKFGDNCTFDGQCSKFLIESICNDGICGCLSGFHGYSIRCVETKRAGEFCGQTAECLYQKELNGNVECQNGRCTCLYGQKDGSCNIEKVNDENSSANKLLLNFFLCSLSMVISQILYTK